MMAWMEDPPFGRDRASYKEQRRKALGNTSKNISDGNVDDGMFFGTSPTERKGLRETVDKRGIDLDKLDLNAVDREKYTDVEKVGTTLRLIDVAMGADEAEPAKPQPKPRPKPTPKPAGKRPTPRQQRAAAPTRALDRRSAPTQPLNRPPRPATPPARPAAGKPKPPPKPKPKPPAKKAGSGKGMKISDMGLTVKPRKVGKQPPKKRPR